MTTASIVGFGLLLLVAVGAVVLWIIDARRAEHVASDPERFQQQPHRNSTRRWRPHTPGHR